MSQKIVQDINNVVDKEKSEYYWINKRKRLFWHSKSVSTSCRVREKNEFNKAPEMALNVRASLLYEEKGFREARNKAWNIIAEADQQQLRQYVYDTVGGSKEKLDKQMGLIIMNLPEEEKRAALHLENVVTCNLLGYEKEFFYLKCYSRFILPVFMLRILYHTKYDHAEFKEWLEDEKENGYDLTDPYKGLEFSWYLDKIRFL